MSFAPPKCRGSIAHEAIALLAFAISATGCGRSCSDDRPYVPYTMDAASGSVSGSLPGPSANPSVEGGVAVQFNPVTAQRAPQGATSLTIDGVSLNAPAERTFKWYLTADFDADGALDVAAWVQHATAPSGELLWAQRKAPNAFAPWVTSASAPPSLNVPGTCRLDAEFSLVGPHTLQLSASPLCTDQSVGVAARTRWVAVVMPARQPATRLEFKVDPPAFDELQVQVDGSDRDGDRLDDVTIYLSIGSDPSPFETIGPTASAELRYFDRPAGLSRDPHEPESSLRAYAAHLQKLSKKKGSLAEVASGARRIHRLHDLVCDDGAGPSFRIQGQVMACGARPTVADADLAEIDAALKSGDPLAALAAEDRMERQSSVLDSRKLAEARSRLDKQIPSQQASVSELVATPLIAPSDAAGWGALTFNADGALLVRENGSVRRFDSGSNGPASRSPAAWPVSVVSADSNTTLVQVLDPCDGNSLRAKFRAAGGDREIALPVVSPLGKACSRTAPAPSAVAISWGATGLELLVNNTALVISTDLTAVRATGATSGQSPTASGPRSPDGKVLVSTSPVGLVVIGSQSTLWKNPRLLDAHKKLRDCTVANDAASVACVEGGKVIRMQPAGKDGR